MMSRVLRTGSRGDPTPLVTLPPAPLLAMEELREKGRKRTFLQRELGLSPRSLHGDHSKEFPQSCGV